VDAVDEALLIGAREALVTRRALAALLDPAGIGIGAETDVGPVCRPVCCFAVWRIALGAVLRGLDMGAGPRSGSAFGHSLEHMALMPSPSMIAASAARSFSPWPCDLTADLGQQIIKNPARHQRIAEPAMGGLIGHRRVQTKPAEPHEIEPHPDRAFQLRIAQPMPLPDQQAFEQHQRIIALRPDPRPLETALQDRPERPPIRAASTFDSTSSSPIRSDASRKNRSIPPLQKSQAKDTKSGNRRESGIMQMSSKTTLPDERTAGRNGWANPRCGRKPARHAEVLMYFCQQRRGVRASGFAQSLIGKSATRLPALAVQ
jgi:hypothetical protein